MTKKTKSKKRRDAKPSATQLARREARIAALARAITTMIFATWGGAA